MYVGIENNSSVWWAGLAGYCEIYGPSGRPNVAMILLNVYYTSYN